ncbi:MAG: cyclodeaminase/cyclohydrolase family protein [Planctomycetes bacterium]|nr:cyclodeaminase/cyclohydrolase family protein [Planctomycetota bacterium]
MKPPTVNDAASESLLSLAMDDFLSRTADRVPTPGGGAVAAVAAALAVALSRMVTAYSIGPKTSPEDRARLESTAKRLQRLDGICRRLIDEDAAAYEAYAAAARQVRLQEAPRNTLEEAARLAIAVPLEAQAMTVSLLRLLDEHKALFKTVMRSDLAVSAHLALAACKAARETALINVCDLEFESERTHIYEQSDHFVTTAGTLSEQIVSFVHG